MAAESDMTYDEAQEAMDQGDTVTGSELQEMYPDKTMNQIQFDISMEQAQLELQSKIEEKFEFNEPRAAAKQGRKTCHTGPKGVLTDYEEAKLKMRALRIEDKINRENKMYMKLDSDSNTTKHKLTIIDMKQQKPTKKQLRTEKMDNKSQEVDDIDSDDLLEEEDDLDQEALYQYKLQKMKILQATQARYGDTKEVTAWTFEKEVDGAPLNVWVVIHVYQDVE